MQGPGHLGLNRTEYAAFRRTLEASHKTRVRIDLLDRNEKVRDSLDAPILQGAVQVDARADAMTRQLELVILDPRQRVQFAPGSATEAGIFANDFLRAWYGVYVPSIDQWVNVPLFTGPVTDVERNGNELNVMAEGKEVLALDPCFALRPDHIVKGTKVSVAIRQVMAEAGESKFLLPELPHLRLRKRVNVGRQAERWRIAKRLARDIDRQLFYDGRGRLVMRKQAQQPQFRFYEGQNSIYTSKPNLHFDISEVRNVIVVSGPFQGDKPGKVPPVVVYAHPAHPLSGQSLSRNGKPRWMVEFIDAEHAKNRDSARSLGQRILRDRLMAGIGIDFECFPLPFFEEGDMVSARIEGAWFPFRLHEFTIPLTPEPMSVGALKRIRKLRKKNKR